MVGAFNGEMVGACNGEMLGACNLQIYKKHSYKIFASKSETRSPFGRFRHKWETNIKIYVKESVLLDELDSVGSV